MANTSRKNFDGKFKKDIWEYFFNEIKNVKSWEGFESVLNKYFSPREKVMFEKRLGVFYLLKEGNGSKQIGEKIDITLKTISYIKRGYKPPVKKNKKRSVAKKESWIPEWALKKNSKFPTYVGKGRWHRQ